MGKLLAARCGVFMSHSAALSSSDSVDNPERVARQPPRGDMGVFGLGSRRHEAHLPCPGPCRGHRDCDQMFVASQGSQVGQRLKKEGRVPWHSGESVSDATSFCMYCVADPGDLVTEPSMNALTRLCNSFILLRIA